MNHLIISREYPPCPYGWGGIATYAQHIARLLAARGETVHVIGEQWDRAPHARETFDDGRLVIHRVSLGRPLQLATNNDDRAVTARVLEAMAESEFPAQSFSWQASLLAESLVETAGIDVIEAQDYEAPLYYFLLRRSLGLGPTRRPPCFVHLHSPWEFICHYNDWGIASDYDLTIKRLEDHAICAADALLCPSRSLAAQAESHYGLDVDSIERIPYPIGETPFIERPPDTWDHGTICYIGRLEPRKGVLEWIEAAVAMAAERPDVRFEFIGSDTSLTDGSGASVRAVLEARVPPPLKRSFTFCDAQPQARLWERLSRAQLVVVPSRWENFPYACIEAMGSGLPALGSANGGTAEMIEDGRTGWLADTARPADLLLALRHALATPADVRSKMGRAAAAAIRRMCDNAAAVDRHLAFRERLASQGASRSLRLPILPAWAPPSVAVRLPSRAVLTVARSGPASVPRSMEGTGVAVVITDVEGGRLDPCLSSLKRQTRQPSAVVVVTAEPVNGNIKGRVEEVAPEGDWRLVVQPRISADAARDLGIRTVLETFPLPLGIAVVDAGCRLETRFVEACESALEYDERVGIVSSWSGVGDDRRRVEIRPCPALPYQWIRDDASPCCTIRTAALRDIEWVGEVIGGTPESDDLVLALLTRRWLAVTYPSLLSRGVEADSRAAHAQTRSARSRLRCAIIGRFPERVAEDAPLLLHLVQAMARARAIGSTSRPPQFGRGALAPRIIFRLRLSEQLRLVGRGLQSPGYAARWLSWHARRALQESVARLARAARSQL